MAFLGLLVTVFSLIVGGYLLLNALGGFFLVPGWASIMLSLWFIGGLTMLFLGIVGVYVGRAYREVKGRPSYIVDQEASSL